MSITEELSSLDGDLPQIQYGNIRVEGIPINSSKTVENKFVKPFNTIPECAFSINSTNQADIAVSLNRNQSGITAYLRFITTANRACTLSWIAVGE